MDTSIDQKFKRNFENLEKFQGFAINDLRNATVKANANFLVAMGVFNYMEVLGSFAYPKGSCSKRFNHVLNRHFPNSYMSFRVNLKKLSGSKDNAYKIFRCGLTHEYVVKTYLKKKGVNDVRFRIIGVDSAAGYQHVCQTRVCGIEILTLNDKDFRISFYLPSLIRDLDLAFESYKMRLINSIGDSRKSFNLRCENINFNALTEE
jgi:hypothetical protein